MTYSTWSKAYQISRNESRAYAGYYAYKCNDGLWRINDWVDREKKGQFKTLKELKKHYGWHNE